MVPGATHHSDTGDAAPVRSEPYRAGPLSREIEKEKVKKKLKANVKSRIQQNGVILLFWFQSLMEV